MKLKNIPRLLSQKRTKEDCGKELFCDYCKGYNHARSEDGEKELFDYIEIDVDKISEMIRHNVIVMGVTLHNTKCDKLAQALAKTNIWKGREE